MNIIDLIYNELLKGNSDILTTENVSKLNDIASEIYNTKELSPEQIDLLKKIVMIGNVTYNRMDTSVLPLEDGFYDLLLEKYKQYDSHFQVGSAVVQFKNFKENDIKKSNIEVRNPFIKVDKHIPKDDVHLSMYNGIMRKDKENPIDINRYDFARNPFHYKIDYISKREHNTEHNHPDLVGTLDKCKFVLNQDAIDAGVFNDPNVKVLERDFFGDHIKKGIINPNQEITVVAELKYDGISVEADCTSEVVSARTRGDTGIGEAADITPMLKGYTFKHAQAMIGHKPIGVKFEAIITKSNLIRFNQLRGRSYANCRSATTGLFGASDAYKYRDLITLVPLAIDRNDVPQISNRLEEIEFINKVFVSHGEPLRYCVFSGTLPEILYYAKAFWDEAKVARNYLNFLYDGIVISYLDEGIKAKLGRKNYINKFSMAVKFDPLEKQTIFRGYTYEVGQHGNITPMIHYDPVEFMGTIHNKSSGSSYERFQNLGLKIGDYINIKYVNDVMPYVSRLDCDHNRNNPNPLVEFPKVCPICGTKLILSDTGKTAICPNKDCPGRASQRMVNMLAKLNLKGFADASIAALGDTHLEELTTTPTPERFIEAIGEADGINLFNQLQELKTKPINDYIAMGSLGFTGLAYKKWQVILSKITIKDLDELFHNSTNEEDFYHKLYTVLGNIGDATIRTIAHEYAFFDIDIHEIMKWNLIESYGKSNEGKLQIRFTGFRNSQLAELLNTNGYDADENSSVTKKTDILLVPYESFSSSKVDKAKRYGTTIVPLGDFLINPSKYGVNLPN